jgi:large subunit ribosomal protein L10
MSKPVKELIIEDYRKRFNELDGALIVDIRGMTANDNNTLRRGLQKKQIRVTIIKNTLAKKAFSGTRLEGLTAALEGPSALAYGAASVVDVARELVDWARKVKHLALKGAVLDGHYYGGVEGVRRLSTFPTREEAQAKVVQLVLSPASNLLRAATSPGSNVLGIIKTIQERLEKGQAIAKAS